jgi:hypothetical protein
MKCRAIQDELLLLADPGRPGDAVVAHLRDCAACRQWHSRLLQVEKGVSLLAIPGSTRRAQFLHQFLGAPAAPCADSRQPARVGTSFPAGMWRTVRRGWSAWQPGRSWAAAGAVAAAAFLLLLAGSLVRTTSPVAPVTTTVRVPTRDPFVAGLLECNLRLAEAESPHPRMEAVADLADRLYAQMRKILRGGEADDQHDLAKLYARVIKEGLLRNAKTIAPDQRLVVLEKISERVSQTGEDADSLVAEVADESVGALRLIATVSREAADQLRTLTGEPKAMNRLWPSPALVALSVMLTTGRELQAPQLEENPRAVLLLQRNRALILELVDGGIALASAEDALVRADFCSSLAARMAKEIGEAATGRDNSRITEMGDHLEALLKRGVAANLTVDRLGTNLGSVRENQIRRVSKEVKNLNELTKPLEVLLDGAAKSELGDLRRTLQSIHEAQQEVEMTVTRRNVR